MSPTARKAYARAEGLLRGYLTPEQWKDWEEYGAFNVRGSNRVLYRLAPQGLTFRGSGQVGQNGMLTNVWPVGLGIPADWALAMMLYVESDAETVYRSGCHDHYEGNHITDYGGVI